jgi:hypothetical protein
MKKVMTATAAILLAVLVTTGCVTSKVSKVDPNTGQTNIVVVVNEANLLLDSAVLQAATAIGINAVRIQTKNDPGVIQALKNAKVALDGIISGANPQTTDQVLAILRTNGNAALEQQVSSLVQTASALEQQLLAKYGKSVAGEITVSILKSIDAGLAIGLAGA